MTESKEFTTPAEAADWLLQYVGSNVGLAYVFNVDGAYAATVLAAYERLTRDAATIKNAADVLRSAWSKRGGLKIPPALPARQSFEPPAPNPIPPGVVAAANAVLIGTEQTLRGQGLRGGEVVALNELGRLARSIVEGK